MLERTTTKSPFYNADHEAFRDVMRRFVTREIEPYAHEWDEAGEFPRALYAKASEIGLLGLGFPEEYGGGAAGPVIKNLGSPGNPRPRAGGGRFGPVRPTPPPPPPPRPPPPP